MLFSCCYFTTTTAILDFHNHLQSNLLSSLSSLSSLSADILMSYFMEKIWAYQEGAFNFFSEPKLVSLLPALSCLPISVEDLSLFLSKLLTHMRVKRNCTCLHLLFIPFPAGLTLPHGWNWAYLEEQCFPRGHFSSLKWTWSVWSI